MSPATGQTRFRKKGSWAGVPRAESWSILAASSKIAKRRKPASKAKQNPQPKPAISERPLPPPVEINAAQPAASDGGLFGLRSILGNGSPQNVEAFSAHSAASSTTEPAPGEPLPAESERLVEDIPTAVGETGGAVGRQPTGVSGIPAAESPIDSAFLQGLISFDAEDVRGVLEEGFDFLAERFDSEHWKLTERQSRMLGRPTTELLTSIWTKLSLLLPDQLAQWCTAMPGLAGFVLTSSIVVGPKIAQQLAVSRQRRAAPKRVIQHGPVPVSPRVGPVGPIDSSPVQAIETDHSFE